MMARTSSRRVNAKRRMAHLPSHTEPLPLPMKTGPSGDIGQLVPGKGVYLGIWSPSDRHACSINKMFNVYAAPYDLGLDENGHGSKLIITYNDAVKAVSEIKNLMGHNGAQYKNDTELYDALRSGSYKGEWFIPTRDLVNGTDVDGIKVQHDNLYQHRNTGKFANTFTTASGSDYPDWYWSSTEHRGFPSFVWDVRLSDGNDAWDHKDNSRLSCRPVRLVEAGAPRLGAGEVFASKML